MSSFFILKQKILNYFPLVHLDIPNIYEEHEYSYNKYHSFNPLKYTHDEQYSPDIMQNLQTLRMLLRSNISNERFMYELNMLNNSWGKGGYYGHSILDKEFVNLIHKINKDYVSELEYERKIMEKQLENEIKKEREFNLKIRQQQEEMIKHANKVTVDYELDQLNNEMLNFNIKYRALKLPRGGINKNKKNELDLSKLKIHNNKK